MADRTSVYLTDATVAVLGDEGRSGRINGIVARYARICREALPALSRAEWCAALDALNGALLLDGLGRDGEAEMTGYLWAEVADTPGLGPKWAIDQDALVAQLRALTYVERVAVLEAARAFWARPHLDTDAALAAAGIVPA